MGWHQHRLTATYNKNFQEKINIYFFVGVTINSSGFGIYILYTILESKPFDVKFSMHILNFGPHAVST